VARLPYIDPATAPNMAELLQALPDLHLFRMIAHAETVMTPWLGLGGALLSSLSLDPVLRELAVLQVAVTTGNDYERVQHQAIAAAVGAPDAAVEAVLGHWLDAPALTGHAPVLRVVEQLVTTHSTTPAGIDALRAHLDERQTVELLLLVGYYLGLAVLIAAVDLDPDAPAHQVVADGVEAKG